LPKPLDRFSAQRDQRGRHEQIPHHRSRRARSNRAKKITPGELPPSRIPIFDAQGRRRGHVGHKASAATVARFGVHNAKLGTRNNRVAWIGKTLAEVSAMGATTAKVGGNNS